MQKNNIYVYFRKLVVHFILIFCGKTIVIKVLNQLSSRLALKRSIQGKLTFPYVKKRNGRILQILNYHRVNDDRDPLFPGVPIRVFRQQMEFLAENYEIWPLEPLIDEWKRNDIPGNALSITFDDGYKDNYVHAFPILNYYRIPATIFLATGSIGTQRPLWHDRVFSAFRSTKRNSLIGYGDPPLSFQLSSMQDKLRAQHAVLCFLRRLSPESREFWIARLTFELEVDDQCDATELMLNWNEVRIMFADGITFGSHTVSHPILSRISREQMYEEILDSKDTIEREINSRVTLFAYPNGGPEDFSEETKQLLKDVGYKAAVTTMMGVNEQGQDLFELKRATPWDEDIRKFGARLSLLKLDG